MAFCGNNNDNGKQLSAQDKVTAEWDAMAGEWDDMAAGYARSFYQLLDMDKQNDNNNLTIVDFGCGTGLLTEKLRPHAKQLYGIDVSKEMIKVLKEKIRSNEWDNVQARAMALANVQNGDDNEKWLDDLEGTVDMIVASSVMSFIPPEDMDVTMQKLAKLLKPKTGIFCHSDWPKTEAKHPDAMDEDKAKRMYSMGGLQPDVTKIESMDMGDGQCIDVFYGVARKNE